MVPAGATFFAAAGEFVDSGPRACFCSFHADAFSLVAGFDVCRLTFLFVSITGFIALRHGVPCLVLKILLFVFSRRQRIPTFGISA